MIYDDVLDITWMQSADYLRTNGLDTDDYVNYATASSWADSLDFTGYNDQRIPNRTPINGTNYDLGLSYDGSTDKGFNDLTQTCELSCIFYHNLNNISYWSAPMDNPIANAAWGFNLRILIGFATGENQLLNTPIIDPPVVANAPNTFAMLFLV